MLFLFNAPQQKPMCNHVREAQVQGPEEEGLIRLAVVVRAVTYIHKFLQWV